MQGIHPEDHLLQAPRRHHPDQDAGHRPVVEHDPARLDPARPVPDPTDHARERDRLEATPTSRGRAREVRDVPAEPRNQGHQPGVADRGSAIDERPGQDVGEEPARGVDRPVSTFCKTTSAGLNRWGSTA